MRDRVDGLDRSELTEEAAGSAQTAPGLTPDECRAIAALYDDAGRFRSTVDMAATVRSGVRHTLGLVFHDAA